MGKFAGSWELSNSLPRSLSFRQAGFVKTHVLTLVLAAPGAFARLVTRKGADGGVCTVAIDARFSELVAEQRNRIRRAQKHDR